VSLVKMPIRDVALYNQRTVRAYIIDLSEVPYRAQIKHSVY